MKRWIEKVEKGEGLKYKQKITILQKTKSAVPFAGLKGKRKSEKEVKTSKRV